MNKTKGSSSYAQQIYLVNLLKFPTTTYHK